MDLGTVRRKLENQKYTKHQLFAKDVRLVFENARTFNPKTHPIHEAATDLLNNFQTEYFRLVQRIDPKTAEEMLKTNKGPVVTITPTKSHKKGASNNHKKKTQILTKVSSSSSNHRSSSQATGRSFEAPRKNGFCTLCQQQVCEQCPMCEAGCLPFEAPALHCRGTCGSRVQRNSSFWALPSTNYFVWCTMCHDNLRPDHPYPIANRTIKKEMLGKSFFIIMFFVSFFSFNSLLVSVLKSFHSVTSRVGFLLLLLIFLFFLFQLTFLIFFFFPVSFLPFNFNYFSQKEKQSSTR